MELKLGTFGFATDVCFNTKKNLPLYRKLTCSPDGYIVKGGELNLVEFKCPFSRAIAKKTPSSHYEEQIQTTLALCQSNVKRAPYVDACFCLCP